MTEPMRYREFKLLVSESDDPRFSHESSHTDPEGYRVTVRAYRDRVQGTGRQGEMHITHPNGESRRAGYWMDYPERGWKHDGVDLHKDYDKHWNRGTEDRSHWRSRVPIQKRLDMESHHQATAYKPLRDQWRERG